MIPRERIIAVLRKIPLVFYVSSFGVIGISLLVTSQNGGDNEFDQFVYQYRNGTCDSIVVLLDYDFRREYMDSIQWFEKADLLPKPYRKLPPNTRVKVKYTHDEFHKILFLKDNEIVDGFVIKEYLQSDSCRAH